MTAIRRKKRNIPEPLLWATTPSYDLETEIDQVFDISGISSELIQATTQQFVGEIKQQPPIFSALKKDGKRLYEFARSGETVEIPTRTITNFGI